MEFRQEIEESLHLFRVLARAYRSVSEHSIRSSKSLGLHPTEFAVLELLLHNGPQPLNTIASRLLLVSGSVTYVADKLEKKGWIRRVPCSNDRRVTLVTLTDEGNRLMEDIFPGHAARIHNALSPLSREEKQALIRLLKKMGIAAQEKMEQGKREH
jgi:MarR family transcriptional regulator, 2-MHQ and catechol-resistance regulon repressor